MTFAIVLVWFLHGQPTGVEVGHGLSLARCEHDLIFWRRHGDELKAEGELMPGPHYAICVKEQ